MVCSRSFSQHDSNADGIGSVAVEFLVLGSRMIGVLLSADLLIEMVLLVKSSLKNS